jgi:hypothetical protein
MNIDLNLDEDLNEYISPIQVQDRALFERFISEPAPAQWDINYENSFDHLTIYFNLGKFQRPRDHNWNLYQVHPSIKRYHPQPDLIDLFIQYTFEDHQSPDRHKKN